MAQTSFNFSYFSIFVLKNWFQVYTMDGVGSAQLHEMTAAAHHQSHDEDEDDHHVSRIKELFQRILTMYVSSNYKQVISNYK